VLIAFCEAIKVHLSESPLCLAVTGQRNLSLANPRLIAGAIAWRIRHLLATTLVGLARNALVAAVVVQLADQNL